MCCPVQTAFLVPKAAPSAPQEPPNAVPVESVQSGTPVKSPVQKKCRSEDGTSGGGRKDAMRRLSSASSVASGSPSAAVPAGFLGALGSFRPRCAMQVDRI